MAGASGNHLLYQQTFQPADNLYFRLQEGLQRARYGDFMAALVLHTTVILEQANVLRELVQDSRALYNKVIENTQAVKGLEAKTAAIERQIIEQNLHLRDMPPCPPPSCNIYPTMGEQQVHVMCAREQPRSRADQPPLVSLARMTHGQQQMEEAYQRQTMISRPPSRTQTGYPPPPPPLVPHPSSNSYSFLNSGGSYPSHRPFGSVTQPPRLYPIPSSRAQQPPSSNNRYPHQSMSRLQPPAILPPPDLYRPLPVTSQSITISTIITTTASSSSSSTTTTSPSSVSSPSESTVLPNLVLPAGITIIPLGPVTSSMESSHQNQPHRRDSPIRNLRPSVVIQAIPEESEKTNDIEKDSNLSDLLRRKRRLMPMEINSMRVLRRFAEGDDEGDFSRELLPYDNQAQRTFPEIDLVPLKPVPLQISDETIVTPGILQHAHLVQTSLVSTMSSRPDHNVAPPTVKKVSQNKGLNLECLLQRIAEYTQNKPASEALPTASDKNVVTTVSVGSRRRKSLTKVTRDKIRQQTAKLSDVGDALEEVGIPTCENVFRNSESDAGIPIIVSVEGSVDVNKFLDDSSEELPSVEEGISKAVLSDTVIDELQTESSYALDRIESNVQRVGPAETDTEVSNIINEFKSIAISPQSEKRLRRNPIILLSRCDQAPLNKLSTSIKAMSSTKNQQDSGRATPPHDLDSAVREIVTELVSYIEMRNTCSPAPLEAEAAERQSVAELPAVTNESGSSSNSSSTSSNVQPKSMTIQNFDVFCVTRDNILKVHNKDYTSTELPQVPTSAKDSPATSENSTTVTKFPTILEVPELESESGPSNQEIRKPMQEMESLPTTSGAVRQIPPPVDVGNATTMTRAIDTENTDVSNLIVTSVSSIIDEAFHSPSTPQDYAAKLLAKLKTIIPDIRVTPVSPKQATDTNCETAKVICNELTITNRTDGNFMSIASGNSLEIEKVVRSGCIPVREVVSAGPLVEENTSVENRNRDLITVGSIAVSAAAPEEAPAASLGCVRSDTGAVNSYSLEETKKTVRKVVNKIVRTVAAKDFHKGIVGNAAITSSVDSGLVTDAANGIDITKISTLAEDFPTKEISNSLSNIDAVITEMVQEITNIVATNVTEYAKDKTARSAENNICGSIIHRVQNVNNGSSFADRTTDSINRSDVIRPEECDRIDNLSSVSAVDVVMATRTSHQLMELGEADNKSPAPTHIEEDAVSEQKNENKVVGGTNTESYEAPSGPTGKLEKTIEIPSVDHLLRHHVSTPAQAAGKAAIVENCTQSVPVVRRVKLIMPVYPPVSSSKSASAAAGSFIGETRIERLVSVDTSPAQRSPRLKPNTSSKQVKLTKSVSNKTLSSSHGLKEAVPDALQHAQKQDTLPEMITVCAQPSSQVQLVEHSISPAVETTSEQMFTPSSNTQTNIVGETNTPTALQEVNVVPPESLVTLVPEVTSAVQTSAVIDTIEVQLDKDRSTISDKDLFLSSDTTDSTPNDTSVLKQTQDICSLAIKPIEEMAEELPVIPHIPSFNPDDIQQVILDLISGVSSDAECLPMTVAQELESVGEVPRTKETLHESQEISIKPLQPSATELAVKPKLPARKPKLNLWGASGYRTRKKRRKARVKPDSLVAAAAADKSVLTGMTTDVSQQLKKKRGPAKGAKVATEKQSDKKSSESGPAAGRRGSVYLGVTVEGEAEVELRTSSKGRVSLFKVVTRDRKNRRSKLSDKTEKLMEQSNLTLLEKKSEASKSAALASVEHDLQPAVVKKRRKSTLVHTESENRTPVNEADISASTTNTLPVDMIAKEFDKQPEVETGALVESPPKRKRGRPKDPAKSPKSKKSTGSIFQVSQVDLSRVPHNVIKHADLPNREQRLQPEGGGDTRIYRVVQAENTSVLPDKDNLTQQKRLKSILVTTRISGPEENTPTASCGQTEVHDKNLPVDCRLDNDVPKMGEEGNYTGALRFVIKRPGTSRSVKEDRIKIDKKSTRMQKKDLSPKSNDDSECTSLQLSKSVTTVLPPRAHNAQLDTIADDSSVSVLPVACVPTTDISPDQQNIAAINLNALNSSISDVSISGDLTQAVDGSHTPSLLVNSTMDTCVDLVCNQVQENSADNTTKSRRKTSRSKDDSLPLQVLSQKLPNASTETSHSEEVFSDSVQAKDALECNSGRKTLTTAKCTSTDILLSEQTLQGTTKSSTKTRRKVVQSKVNRKDNSTVSLPKSSTSSSSVLQDSELLISAVPTFDKVDHETTSRLLPDASTQLQDATKVASKTRRKSAQAKLTKTGTKPSKAPSGNVPIVVQNCNNPVDDLSLVTSTVVDDNMPVEVPLSVTERVASENLQTERAKLQEAVKKATSKTRRKIAKLRTGSGEGVKSFAVLPASLQVNDSSISQVKSFEDPVAEIDEPIGGNVEDSELSKKDGHTTLPSCSQSTNLDDDIVEIITARVRTLESGDPDYAIISLLRDLIDGNDPNVLPLMDSVSSDTEMVDSAGAVTLTRAINIWQEHDYSRFPIEVLKLSENEQEANQLNNDTHNAVVASLSSTPMPTSHNQMDTKDAAEGSRITVARNAIEKLIDADCRRKTGEELQPPSSITNTLRQLLTRVQDQSVTATCSTAPVDNELESCRNKNLPTHELAAKTCSECSSSPSGSKCNHVISVSASSASRLLSLLTQASRKARSQQINNEGLSDSRLPSVDSTASNLNSELNVLRDEDTGDESSASGSSSGQTLNFKQILQSKLQNKLKIDSPSGDSSDVESDDRYRTLLKTFINKKTVITEKNACYVTPERNLNIKTLKHRLSFAIAGGVSTTVEESEESFALQPQVQCVNIFSIHEIWKYLKCFINDASRASLSLHQLGQKEMQQFLVLAKLCCLGAHKDETDLVFEKTEQTQDLTVDMLEEAVKLLEEGNVE